VRRLGVSLVSHEGTVRHRKANSSESVDLLSADKPPELIQPSIFTKQLAERPEASVVISTVLVVLFFALGTHGVWLSSIPSLLRLTAQVGIVAIGQALLMTSGEVDLSVGSVFAFTGVVFVDAMGMGIPAAPAILLALAVACGIGLFNAILTVRFAVPSMIVTLGGMFVFRGLTYLATQGHGLSIPHESRDDPLVAIFKARLFQLNMTVVLLVVFTALFVFVLAKTRFGSHLLAVGGNSTSALANGVSSSSVKTRAFIICSALAGVSAILTVCQDNAIYSTSGVRLELETIAAAVIGGCTLRGGVGSIWGPVLGVFVLASLKGGLMLMGAPTSWYIAFVGAILIGFLVSTAVLRKHVGATA
jgi:ribose/xylose/arabinose/galactoside ABC-type transport system permease subunit